MSPGELKRRRLALTGIALAAALLPRRHLERMPLLCPVRLLSRYPCPTCGMTRSWHSVARLDPVRALRDHPFGPAVLAAISVGAWSPSGAEVIATRAARLPVRLQVATVAGWLGWWGWRLAVTHRLTRTAGLTAKEGTQTGSSLAF